MSDAGVESIATSPGLLGLGQHLMRSRHSHHQTLEILAAKALGVGDVATAFQIADRRCRTEPPPLAHCYVLRAEAARRLGDHDGALADLAEALKISPNDIGALRRLLNWSRDIEREQAALALIQQDHDVGILRTCIEVLAEAGKPRLAAISVYDAYVIGWVAWDNDETAEVSLSNVAGSSLVIEADPFHSLSRHPVRAASFRLPRPVSLTPQLLSIAAGDKSFFQRWLPSNARAAPTNAPQPHLPSGVSRHSIQNQKSSAPQPPTVIVPVYDDLAATRTCIDGLLTNNPSGTDYQILVVNDATPDLALADYLASLPDRSTVELRVNDVNLGFVGSVNRALAEVTSGDVVLLNADTVVPPGFVARLAAAAASSPDIGTVIPLSNNSEISDFPVPWHNNPLGTNDDVIELDRIAASANRDKVVDLPNGNGFCLYVTRACLDAVGPLSDNFHRGYLEDIDFGLRAREHGFRNVCAPSVYVGHAGSRSFKTEKRSLVLRNLGVLDYRFPRFREETSAFIALDPLRHARQALERAALRQPERLTMLFCNAGALHTIAEHRARQLTSQGTSAIIVELTDDHGSRQLRFSSMERRIPQSLAIGVATTNDRQDLEQTLRELDPTHCEFVDIAHVPSLLVDVLGTLNIPYDLWICDDVLSNVQPPRRARETSIKAMIVSTPGDIWQLPGANVRPSADESGDQNGANASRATHDLLTGARQFLAPTQQALRFGQTALRSYKASIVELPNEPICDLVLADAASTGERSGPPTLVIVPTRTSAREFSVIRQIAVMLGELEDQPVVVVAGATLDDTRLMSLDNIFVTGSVTPTELGRTLQFCNIKWMLTDFDRTLFGHPMIEMVRSAKIPVAYVDWSGGEVRSRPGDLAIDVAAANDPERMAMAVRAWVEGR